jgi:hypothetical protein
MGWFSWFSGSDEEEYDKHYGKDDNDNVGEWMKEVADALKDSVDSGKGTSWFDKLFGGGEDDNDKYDYKP